MRRAKRKIEAYFPCRLFDIEKKHVCAVTNTNKPKKNCCNNTHEEGRRGKSRKLGLCKRIWEYEKVYRLRRLKGKVNACLGGGCVHKIRPKSDNVFVLVSCNLLIKKKLSRVKKLSNFIFSRNVSWKYVFRHSRHGNNFRIVKLKDFLLLS